jgi:hypothetical protein
VDAVFPLESDPDELVSPAFFVSFFSELSLDVLVVLELESLLLSAFVLAPFEP